MGSIGRRLEGRREGEAKAGGRVAPESLPYQAAVLTALPALAWQARPGPGKTTSFFTPPVIG